MSQKTCRPVYVFAIKVFSKDYWLVASENEAKKHKLPVKKAVRVIGLRPEEIKIWEDTQNMITENAEVGQAIKVLNLHKKLYRATQKYDEMKRGADAPECSSEPETDKN